MKFVSRLSIIILAVLLFPAVLGAASTDYADDEVIPYACDELSDFSTLVNGNQPNSAAGYGAVDICGACYYCGRADGICPQDFYSGMQADCSQAPDPDCTGCVGGLARVDISGSYTPVSGIKIYASYPDEPSAVQKHFLGTTGSGTSSNFELKNVLGYPKVLIWGEYQDPYDLTPSGFYLSAQVQIDGTAAGCTTVSLDLNQAACEADCTREGSDYCDADCQGVNGCTFYPANGNDYSFSAAFIAGKADEKLYGSKVSLNTVVDCSAGRKTEDFLYACNQPIQTSSSFVTGSKECTSLQPDQSSAIRNLVTRVQRVWYNGEPVELVIAFWEEDVLA